MPYQIVNWRKYQGWKSEQRVRKSDQPYPWLKLHRKIIDSPDLGDLSESERWRFVGLLCLSNDEGLVNLSDRQIAFRLRISEFDPSPFIGKFITNGTSSEKTHSNLRRTSAELPTRGEERRLDKDQAKAVEGQPREKNQIGHKSGPTPVKELLSTRRVGPVDFVAAVMVFEQDERRRDWWNEAYSRCETAGPEILELLWMSLDHIEKRNCTLRDKPRWIRRQLVKAGVQLPAWDEDSSSAA